MTEPSYSGVFIEELAPPSPIAAVDSDTAGFVGVAEPLPGITPPADAITAAADFGRNWSVAAMLAGGVPNLLWPAVQGYFSNGGRRLYIAAVAAGDVGSGGHIAAIVRLAETDAAILAAPDAQALAVGDSVMPALVDVAAVSGSDRFALVDAPQVQTMNDLIDWSAGFDTSFSALFWPWLQAADGTLLPPSGFVAGAIARSTIDRGVWKAPANLPVTGITGLAMALSKMQQDMLNSQGINAIVSLPDRGIRVWGARTLSRDPQWQYVPVRRLGSMLEASVARGLAWAVFEPNGPILWAQVRRLVEEFLQAQWRAGALAGVKPGEAFFVTCDATTMTTDDIAAGRLVVMIGFAPLRPAEFLVLRITASTASS